MKSPLTLLLLLLAFAGYAAAQAGKLLPPTYQAGKTYVLQSSYHGETELGIAPPGQPNAKPEDTKQVVDMEIGMTAVCRDSSKEAGMRLVQSTIDSAVMKLKMGNIVMDYNSAEKGSEETLLGKSLHPMVGKTFTFVINEKDEIVRIEGLEQIPAAPGGMNPFGAEQVKQMTLPAMTLGIPAEGVDRGHAWKQESSINIGQLGKFTVNQNLVYEGDKQVDGATCAVLKNSAGLELNPAAKPKPGGMNIKVQDGVMAGEILVDKALRFPRLVTSRISMNIVLPNPLNQAETIKAPVVNQVTFKLVSVKDK